MRQVYTIFFKKSSKIFLFPNFLFFHLIPLNSPSPSSFFFFRHSQRHSLHSTNKTTFKPRHPTFSANSPHSTNNNRHSSFSVHLPHSTNNTRHSSFSANSPHSTNNTRHSSFSVSLNVKESSL